MGKRLHERHGFQSVNAVVVPRYYRMPPSIALPRPSSENGYLLDHVTLLRRSLQLHTGRDLIDTGLLDTQAAEQLFKASFVLLSHNAASDPVLTYGNLQAMRLFGMSWEQLTAMPSRFTAEAPNRQERARLLAEVATKGFIDNYSGVRRSLDGQRFQIQRATVWNLTDEEGVYHGQAAMFRDWIMLDD